MEEQINGAAATLGEASAVLDAVLANPEPIAAVATLAALGIGASKRGGGKFVMLVAAIPMLAAVIHAVGEIVTKVGDVLETLYEAIKEAQKPAAMVLLLLVPMLSLGCASTFWGLVGYYQEPTTRQECVERLPEDTLLQDALCDEVFGDEAEDKCKLGGGLLRVLALRGCGKYPSNVAE